MVLRKILILTFLLCVSSVGADNANINYDGFVMSPSGVGPIKLGMTVAEAMSQFGIIVPLTDLKDIDPDYDCDSYLIGDYKGFADIRLLLTSNIIRRIDVYVDKIRTSDNSGIGDSLTSLEEKYHVKRVGAHQIGQSELMVYHEKEKTYYLFKGYDTVRSFRVGWEPEVSYIEGCA